MRFPTVAPPASPGCRGRTTPGVKESLGAGLPLITETEPPRAGPPARKNTKEFSANTMATRCWAGALAGSYDPVMAIRPRTASRARRDGRVKQQPGDDDNNLVQSLDQALQSEAKRKKRQRTARELTGALPDVIDGVLDLVQNLWP